MRGCGRDRAEPARARGGAEDAFRKLTDPCGRELQLHIYRIIGSVQDAEDLLQETMLAAWRSLLRRARSAFESRLPTAGRERAPLPDSKVERDIVGRFSDAVEAGDIDGMVAR